MKDCVSVFKDIIENMPKSETSFAMAKEALLKRLATVRTSREWVLNSYFNAQDMGHDHDIDADVYNKVQDMTLDDLVDFQKENVKGRTYRYLILGDSKELDMDFLKSLGEVHEVSTETIFGY
jgi:predicted Zn-dependent peptidase